MKYSPSIVHANFSVFFLDFDIVGGLINDRFSHSDALVQVQYICLAMLVHNAIRDIHCTRRHRHTAETTRSSVNKIILLHLGYLVSAQQVTRFHSELSKFYLREQLACR